MCWLSRLPKIRVSERTEEIKGEDQVDNWRISQTEKARVSKWKEPTSQLMPTNQFMKINSYKTTQGEIPEHSKPKTWHFLEWRWGRTDGHHVSEHKWTQKCLHNPGGRWLPTQKYTDPPPQKKTPTQMKTRKRHMQPSRSQACPDESGNVHQNKGTNQEKQTWNQLLNSTQATKDTPRVRVRKSVMQRALRSANGRRAESCWALMKHVVFLRKAGWGWVPKASKGRTLWTAKRADVTWKG